MATDRWVGAASALTITEKFVLGLGLLGAVLAAIGQAIGGPIVGLGVALLGVAGVVAGVHSVVTREHLTWTDTASHRHSRVSARRHTGAPAMIYGLLFVMIGLVVFVTGLAVAIGRGDELASRAFDNVGVALMFVGGLYCLAGVATTISRWTRFYDITTSWWQRLPGKVVGLLMIVIGVATIGIGRWLAFDPPASPDEAMETILDTLAKLLGG